MKISIEVPDLECSRCSSVGAHQPTLLQLADDGDTWKIVSTRLPDGWMTPPGQSAICPSCAEQLRAALDAFYSGQQPLAAVAQEAPKAWPDAEAKARSKVAMQNVTAAPTRISIAGATQRAQIQRGSNIPAQARPIPKVAVLSRADAPVQHRTSRMASLPTRTPAPAASIAGDRPPPAPQATIVTERQVAPSIGGRVTRVSQNTPTIQHQTEAPIPTPAQPPEQQTTGAVPLEAKVLRESPPTAPVDQPKVKALGG